MKTKENGTVIVERTEFGKDHWSLFAYCETRAVDYRGVLDPAHLRLKNSVLRGMNYRSMTNEWKPEYGTRLKGFWNEDSSKNAHLQLSDHDDLDCLDDLEAEGLIEHVGTGLHPAIVMTKKGREVASELREHKANGGMFANFEA
jgi:hypothetical protein